MGISRKEFFRQGLFSLGKAALDLTGNLAGATVQPQPAFPGFRVPGEPHPDMVGTPFNERCLARSCGCFACVERCEPQAILLVQGEGIRVDSALCNGCGTCEYVCPVVPRAVALAPREKQS